MDELTDAIAVISSWKVEGALQSPILLYIDHGWISNKSIPLHPSPLYPFCPQVHPISVTSLTPLHLSLLPLFYPLSLSGDNLFSALKAS